MLIKKLSAVILAAVLAVSLIALPSCGKNKNRVNYESASEAIHIFEEGFNVFMSDESSQVEILNYSDEQSPQGNKCGVRYLKSSDGAFENITFEVERGSFVQVDEYFRLSDGNTFVARSYFDPETHEPHIEKYYLADGKLYSIDEESSTLTEVEDPASLDFFTDFDALAETYGSSDT